MSDITKTNEELDFMAMLDDYMPKTEEKGERVVGVISQMDRNYAYLDVTNTRTAVRVRAEELVGYSVGEEAEVVLKGESKDNEFIIGSRFEIDKLENLGKLEEAFEKQEIVKGTIEKKVKGGYIVKVLFQQGFLPNSLSEIALNDTENHVGEEVDLLIKDLKDDRDGKKVLVSRKDIRIREEMKYFETLTVGDIIDVNVKSILDFGLSVRNEKANGFIHISEISWGKVENIGDLYSVGDSLKAKIISIDNEKRSLKLSVKQLSKDPWEDVEEKYPVEKDVEGKVTRLAPFGAFVELEEGIEGLVHTSDFTWNKKKVNISEYVKVGDQVKVRVIELDKGGKRLKFGIKQLSVDPWLTAEERYKEGDTATGKIVEVKDFGIFVEIESGIDVFVHKSDFTWNKEVVKFEKGDTIEVKILTIDYAEKKVKGGIKQLTKSPWELVADTYNVGDVVEKKVTNIKDFGIFVELSEGVDGMIHSSQVSKEFVKDLNDKFKVGDLVKAEIIEIDRSLNRIKLSIKKMEINEAERENKELLEKYGVVGEEN